MNLSIEIRKLEAAHIKKLQALFLKPKLRHSHDSCCFKFFSSVSKTPVHVLTAVLFLEFLILCQIKLLMLSNRTVHTFMRNIHGTFDFNLLSSVAVVRKNAMSWLTRQSLPISINEVPYSLAFSHFQPNCRLQLFSVL